MRRRPPSRSVATGSSPSVARTVSIPLFPSHVDFARHALVAQIGGCELGGREQQIGARIDRGATFLLGPWELQVVRPEARFDMGHGHAGGERSERAAERAGGIPLHDQQVGWAGKHGGYCRGDPAHVAMRILLAGAIEPDGGETAQPELCEVEIRMLAGQEQARVETALRETICDGCQFDCFGPGTDDQPDVGETQPSP
jgi:hypothetical protein